MMVQEIDFLPESFHTRRQQSRKKIWRRGILVVFLLIIGTSTLQQRIKQRRRELNRDRLQQRAAKLIAQLDDADALRRKIDLADAKANLLTSLRVQVTPTRILAAVTSNLPEFVSLTELHTNYEKTAVFNALARKTQQNDAIPENADESGEMVDLERLKSQRRETALYVSLKGVAPNDIIVARYLALLQETDVFDEALLEFTESELYQGYKLRRFGVRLKVSQPGDHIQTPRKKSPPGPPVPEPALAKSKRQNTFSDEALDNPSAAVERIVR